jgi:Ala-tRNA(Pro) deacylase
MAVPVKIKAWLSEQKVRYTTRKHPVAYTAQEIAAASHVSGKQLAKCVLVLTDAGPRLAVLPATQLIDFGRLKALLRVKTVKLAREGDIKRAFPDVEVGAMPPIGACYGVPMVMDRALADGKTLVCNAGTHTETMTLDASDVVRVNAPRLGSFGVSATPPPKPSKKKASTAAKTPGRATASAKPRRPSTKKPATSARKKPAKKARR